MSSVPPLFDGLDIDLSVLPGFADVHEPYRMLRDQKDMVCGAYALTYLLQAYGVGNFDGDRLTVNRVAEAAGTALEPRNDARRDYVEGLIADEALPAERAGTWFMHDHATSDLLVTEGEGGTSPEGVVRACDTVSRGRINAVPIPAAHGSDVQLDADRFSALLKEVSSGTLPAQLIFNYNLRHTLSPAGLLGHKYNLVSLLTHWDDPSYFRRMDWDVGHFTTLAARATRSDSSECYLLIRDSYKTFGWNGYHLQPESYVRRGLERPDDHRSGGVLLVTPTTELEIVRDWLDDHDLAIDPWDNGSALAMSDND